MKDNHEIIEFLIDRFIASTSDKKSIFNYFMKITANLSPLEVDVSLDLLSSKLNTAKDILKKELRFQTSYEKEDVTEQTISSISIFKDLIIAEMISNEFSSNEEIEQLMELNSEFKKLVEGIKNENSKKEDYLMDVNKLEVEKIAQENKVEILIHGHVHRPKVHNEAFGQRIVLGDWDKKYWFISLKGEKISLHSSEIT